jgi:hypothetical protein
LVAAPISFFFFVAALLRGRLANLLQFCQSGIFTTQYRHYKSFGGIIVANALAG